MKSIEEIILETILWNKRFEAYKKNMNLTREEQQKIMFVYNNLNYIHMNRVYMNPSVQKLLISNYITSEII